MLGAAGQVRGLCVWCLAWFPGAPPAPPPSMPPRPLTLHTLPPLPRTSPQEAPLPAVALTGARRPAGEGERRVEAHARALAALGVLR